MFLDNKLAIWLNLFIWSNSSERYTKNPPQNSISGNNYHSQTISDTSSGIFFRQNLGSQTSFLALRCFLTDSLSDTEDKRVFPARCRLLVSEDWLVKVERRVDIKLLLLNRSLRGTHSRTPRHGIYFAMADLKEKWFVKEGQEHWERKLQTAVHIFPQL